MELPYIDIHTHRMDALVQHKEEMEKCRIIEVVDNSPCSAMSSIGVHPWEVDDVVLAGGNMQDLNNIIDTRIVDVIKIASNASCRNILNDNSILHSEISANIVALGEIGLDYHHARMLAKVGDHLQNIMQKYQRLAFCRQIEIANTYSLPIIIHSVRAMQDTMQIIDQYSKTSWVWHGFSKSSLQMVYQILKMKSSSEIGSFQALSHKEKNAEVGATSVDGFISFGPRLIANLGLQSVFRDTDINHIFLETDQDCTHTIEVLYGFAAKLRNMNIDEFKQHIFNNFLRWSGKKEHNFYWE